MTTQLINPNSLSLRTRGEDRGAGHARTLHPLLPWMLLLLPGNVLVALDVARGVIRFDIWLLRFMPALLVLAVTAWAAFTHTPAATRLRKELRLALPVGLPMLLVSSVALCADTYDAAAYRTSVVNGLWVIGQAFLSPVVVVVPWVLELRSQTWTQMLAQPLGRRALLEKFTLSAGLVVVSALTASVGDTSIDRHFLPMAHVLALSAALPLFLLLRNGFLAISSTFVLLVVQRVGVKDLAAKWPVGSVGLQVVLITFVIALLLVLPRQLRRLPLVEADYSSTARAGGWLRFALPWRAELEPLRLLLVLPALGLLGLLGFTFDGGDGAALPLFVCCATVALLSPGIVFSEARRLGTLDPLLAVLPRRVVFQRKLVASGLFTLVTCVVLPTVAMRLTRTGHWADLVAWLVGMGFLFAVGLVVAHFTKHAALTLSVGGGVAAVLAGAQTALAEGSVVLLRGEFLQGHLLAASFVGTSLVLMAMAWLNFSGRITSSRVLAFGGATCLAQALALAVVGSALEAPPASALGWGQQQTREVEVDVAGQKQWVKTK